VAGAAIAVPQAARMSLTVFWAENSSALEAERPKNGQN
jgi:hypothetical protein